MIAPSPSIHDSGPPAAARLLENSNDWMWSVDAAGRHTYTNGAITRILGYSQDDLLAIPDFTTLLHPDDRERAALLLGTCVANRTGWANETFRWRRSDGSYCWLESNGTPLFDDAGRLTGFCGADRDVTSRMEQDLRLAESERRFRLTFECAGVGIAHVGADGRWLRVNEILLQMLGYEMDELMKLTFQDITHPEDLDADLAMAERLFAGEIRSYSMEKRYIRKDATTLWVSLTGSVVRDERGALEYAVAVVRDISERKAIEVARLQAERDYRTLFDSSHDLVLLVDPADGTIITANRRASELYGYTAGELHGMPMTRLTIDAGPGMTEVRRVIAGACEARFETTHRRRDGRLLHLQAALGLVNYGGRNVILATYRDATEEGRLLRALTASERRLRQIVDHGYDMLAITDAAGRMSFVSASVQPVLGCPPEALVGRVFTDVVHPDDQQQVASVFADVLRTPGARASVICRIGLEGQTRWCEGTGVNMLDVEGVEGVVIIARDITERRELEERVENARRVESLGQVAATVAHEFNNVLMTIQPVAELLGRRHGASADIAGLASRLSAGVQRGRAIAGHILRFAHPAQPSRQRTNLAEWLSGAEEELRSLAGAGIRIETSAGGGLEAEADPQQLHQLLTNLVLNAADAMQRAGTISIGVARVTPGADPRGLSWVEISVADSGPGISPEVRARIFEPFFTTKAKGTGLGLALCQQIATAHGGTIRAESRPEGGTAVVVRLPALPRQRTEAAQRRRLLMVEDDPGVAESLMLMLGDTYAIEWSSRGLGVLDKVRASTPDLVMLDVQLQDADGVSIYRQLREQSLHVPVVLMSGSISVDPRELDCRAAFLTKPFAAEDLVSVAAAFC